MSEIPDDVMERARSFCWLKRPSPLQDQVVDTLARAIMAERERCAKVAQDRAQYIRSNEMYPAYGLNSQAAALDDIADRIYSGR